MRNRVKVSIVICVVFLILSSAITAISHYINNGSLPGVSSKSFAPVTVNKVPDNEDIVVQVYQTGIPRHNDQSNRSDSSNPEIYSLLKSCELDAVIYMGTHDGYGEDPTSFDLVLELMPSAELVIIDGADHYFEGEYGEMMVEDACGKITSWS